MKIALISRDQPLGAALLVLDESVHSLGLPRVSSHLLDAYQGFFTESGAMGRLGFLR
jgi:hypothetical protein